MFVVSTLGRTVECATLLEAVELALSLYQAGEHPSIADATGEVRCRPMRPRHDAKGAILFAFSFAPIGCYKSCAMYRAEAAGIRWASHRAGYRGSKRAAFAFAKAWDDFLAWCARPEVAAMRQANRVVA